MIEFLTPIPDALMYPRYRTGRCDSGYMLSMGFFGASKSKNSFLAINSKKALSKIPVDSIKWTISCVQDAELACQHLLVEN